MEKEGGNALGSDRFLGGAENHSLSKPMVYHDQKRIKRRRHGEIGDQIAGDLLEGVGCGGADRGERGNRGMRVGLVLLANGTAINIFPYIGGEAGPPEFRCYELAGFQIAGMTGGDVVVTTLQDRAAKGVIGRNIDTSLVREDTGIELPVREARAEGSRDVFFHRLKSLKDERVGGGGGLNAGREGSVNNVDKEGFRK